MRTIKDSKKVSGKFSYIFSVKRNFLSFALKVGSVGACVTVGGRVFHSVDPSTAIHLFPICVLVRGTYSCWICHGMPLVMARLLLKDKNESG